MADTETIKLLLYGVFKGRMNPAELASSLVGCCPATVWLPPQQAIPR